MRSRRFFVGFALAAVLIAGVVSYFASGSPDGLERVAGDHGIAAAEEKHATGESPLADYGVRGVDSDLLSGGLAGVIGVGVVLVVAGGIAFLVRRKSDSG
jgi:PDGLE domain